MSEIRIHDRGRGPELMGTRTTVYDVIPYLEGGWQPADIAAAMGHTAEQILALCRYIEEHRDEVMAVHHKIEERIRRGNPPEIEEKLKASRAKLLARREELRQMREQGANGASNPG